MEGSDKLFIELVYSLDVLGAGFDYGLWIPEFLDFILHNHLLVYHCDQPPKKRVPPYNSISHSQVITNIQGMLDACLVWLGKCTGAQGGDGGLGMLRSLTNLWCQE